MILVLMSISCILTAKFANIDADYSDLLQCSSGHLNDSKAQISQILITEPKRCCIIFTLCLDSCPLGLQCWSIGWPFHHIHYLANLKAALRIFKWSEKCWQAVLQYRMSVCVSSVDGGIGAPSWAYTGKVPCLDASPLPPSPPTRWWWWWGDDIYDMMKCLSVTKNYHFPLPSWAPEAQSEPPARPCRP